MSSQPLFARAAMGRHFIFSPLIFPSTGAVQKTPSRIWKHLSATPKLAAVTPASRLEMRVAAELVSSGITEIDCFFGGLPRGCLTEICGPASSGRTSLLLAAVAAATQRQEVCALVDTSDALDPQSAAAAGVDLKRLLWIRCSPPSYHSNQKSFSQKRLFAAPSPDFTAEEFFNSSVEPVLPQSNRAWERPLEQALKTADLLLQSSGFGLVAIDFGDVPFPAARRIPLTSWFRFRRAVENTSTVLLVIGQQSCAKTCASLVLRLEGMASGVGRSASGRLSAIDHQRSTQKTGEKLSPTHTQMLEGLQIRTEVVHSRLQRKPVRSAEVTFETKTAWAR